MAQMSQWFANELLKIAFNRDSYTPAWTQLEVHALKAEAPIESDVLLLQEPTSDPAYVVQTIPFLTQFWTFGQLGEVYNANPVTFPVASIDWGQIPNYALVASSYTGGFTAMLAAVGYFPQVPRIGPGDQLQIAANTIFFGLYDGH